MEEQEDLKPPPKLEGWLNKESPAAVRQMLGFAGLSYQKRFVTVDSAKLYWSSEKARPSEDSKGSFVDLMANECEIVEESGELFILKATPGKWAQGGFTGADADRVFRFDCSGSDNPKKKWLKTIKDHINYAIRFKLSMLSKVPIVKRLPHRDAKRMAAACVGVTFEKNEEVVSQGDNGDEFFVILSGEASVQIADSSFAPAEVASLRAGDYFGENALRYSEPRAATVVANSTLSTLKINRQRFHELCLNNALKFPERGAVGIGNTISQVDKLHPETKTSEEQDVITQALRSNVNLKTLATMDDARIQQVIDVARKRTIEKGVEIISEGELDADYFYIVVEGRFEITLKDPSKGSARRAPEELKEGATSVGPGGCFGELALLYLEPRSATVTAMEKSVVFAISRNDFKEILMKVPDTKVAEYIQHLEGVSSLSSLLPDERRELAMQLVEVHFMKGDTIIEQGDVGNTFYILFDGQVEILKNRRTVKTLSADLKTGVAQYFGEAALLDNEVRAATVRVSSDEARALAMDRDTFEGLLGPLKEIMDQSRKCQKDGLKRKRAPGKFKLLALNAFVLHKPEKKRPKIYKRDLQKIGLLGCGGFGVVDLVEHKVTGECYALKALSKGFILKSGMQKNVMHEKEIQIALNSQFIVKLWETYNEPQKLFFLLEPALGGELYATYMRKSFHGSVKHAQYYCAAVVFAFEYLHGRNIIYRDLKPENLLLTDKGHLKVTDMGLAKVVHSKTHTSCGTPDYFAPEIIKSTGHNRAVDWWELGILIFELMSGYPPFESADPMETYGKVCQGIQRVHFPLSCQGIVADLVKQLCKKQPSERLPMRAGGTKNIRQHPWFVSTKFDWEAMRLLSLPVPYKPEVKSKKDLQNFPSELPNKPRHLEYEDDNSGWDKDFATSTDAPPAET